MPHKWPSWLGDVIGAPFLERGRGPEGWDCWGICCRIYEEAFKIHLPSYAESYKTTTDEEEISALVRGEAQKSWMEQPLAAAQLGDVLIIRMRGQPMHTAVVIDPPWFLHTEKGIGAVLEQWDCRKWEKRIVAVYRHYTMIQGAA